MRRAVATGHPSPACVDRLSIDLVKQGEKTEAAIILQEVLMRTRPPGWRSSWGRRCVSSGWLGGGVRPSWRRRRG